MRLPLLCLAAAILGAADTVIPLPVFGLAPGQALTIAGTPTTAGGAGLNLPIGTPTALAWTGADGTAAAWTVIAVDATDPHAPPWALDPPKRGDAGVATAVGLGDASNLMMATRMAAMDARREIASLAAVTTIMPDGATRTTSDAVVTTRTSESWIIVWADAAHRPTALITRAGGNDRVRCWTRMTGTLGKPAGDPAARHADRLQADKAFADLDRLIDQGMSNGK